MEKLSKQKKVEFLEKAVLNGTVEETARIMEEHAPFEFTARALGYAVRFRGVEMVKCLIEHGATFAYEPVPAFVKKYATKVVISNFYSYSVDYSLYLLKDQKIDPVPDGMQILADEERAAVLELLCAEAERACPNTADIFYFATLFGDTAVLDACSKLNICGLSEYRMANIRCDINYAHMDGLDRHHRDTFTWTLRRADPETFCRILTHILPLLGEKPMQLMPADLYQDFNMGKKQFFSAYCAEGLFELALKHTNLIERAKKWDLLYALVDHNNASGVQYALEQEWISKPKDLETLLKYAQSKESIKAELVGSLLDRLKKNAPVKKKEDPLALSANPLSAAELKKIWSTKKLDDGTLMITGYKGEALDVIIPDKIGKKPVTALGPDVFNTKAPRITREQADIRQNLHSIEVPGSIGMIPQNFFGCIFGFTHWRMPNLKRVVLGEGIREIGYGAFMGCTGLEEVVFPQSLTTLKYGAFYNCTSLQTVHLPQGVTSIGPCAFYNCTSLKDLIIPESAKWEDNSFANCTGLPEETKRKYEI